MTNDDIANIIHAYQQLGKQELAFPVEEDNRNIQQSILYVVENFRKVLVWIRTS